MNVEQFVMAYKAEQDRLRALLPDGFESLRPVLRINAEIRQNQANQSETVYLEFNTPVYGFGKRGWLNIAHWESPADALSYRRGEHSVTFFTPFLEITYTGVGRIGGCPAEKDNDGCFFPDGQMIFVPAERIDSSKEYCDCEFAWHFAPGNAHGVSVGGNSVSAVPTQPQKHYARQVLSAPAAAAIECEQILGSYVVRFER